MLYVAVEITSLNMIDAECNIHAEIQSKSAASQVGGVWKVTRVNFVNKILVFSNDTKQCFIIYCSVH